MNQKNIKNSVRRFIQHRLTTLGLLALLSMTLFWPNVSEAKKAIRFDKTKMAEFKKNYDLTKAAGQPAVAVEQLFKDFKIKNEKCSANKLSEKIKACEKYTCTNATNISGVPALEEINVARRELSVGDAVSTCLVSTFDKRYFVVDEKRESFAVLFTANRLNPDYVMGALQLQADVAAKNKVAAKEVVRRGVDLCHYDVNYEFAADLTGFTQDKSIPFEKPGVSVSSKGSHFTTVVMVNGKTYRPVNASDANPKIYARLVDYKLAPSASDSCQKFPTNLIYELEKTNQVQQLFPLEN